MSNLYSKHKQGNFAVQIYDIKLKSWSWHTAYVEEKIAIAIAHKINSDMHSRYIARKVEITGKD